MTRKEGFSPTCTQRGRTSDYYIVIGRTSVSRPAAKSTLHQLLCDSSLIKSDWRVEFSRPHLSIDEGGGKLTQSCHGASLHCEWQWNAISVRKKKRNISSILSRQNKFLSLLKIKKSFADEPYKRGVQIWAENLWKCREIFTVVSYLIYKSHIFQSGENW